MKKTITAIITAAMSAAMLTPFAAGAATADSGKAALTEGYTLVEDCHLFDRVAMPVNESNDFEEVYVNEDGTVFLCFTKAGENKVSLKLKDDSKSDEVIAAITDFLGEGYETEQKNGRLYVRSPGGKQALALCDMLEEKELIEDFGIRIGRQEVKEYNTTAAVNCYEVSYFDKESREWYDTEDKIGSFVASELEGYSVEFTANYNGTKKRYVVLVPPEGTDLAGQLAAAEKIYEATGVTISAMTKTAVFSGQPENEYDIDVYNAVMGDSNLDGKVTVADSVAILQHIANRDKYELSAQGSFNADADFNGITGADALAIQQLDSQGVL